jgi:hypothetical protein
VRQRCAVASKLVGVDVLACVADVLVSGATHLL